MHEKEEIWRGDKKQKEEQGRASSKSAGGSGVRANGKNLARGNGKGGLRLQGEESQKRTLNRGQKTA